jgi:two-component system chemotaxis response regulator CheY
MSSNGASGVMVVDDDDDVCDAIRESLEDAGYDVSVAEDGARALGALRAASSLPSLILLDLMMPVMDGAEFLREMRADPRLASLPVVLFSADGGAHAKAMSLGANDALRKPVQLRDLLSMVSKHCGHDEATD